MPRFRVNRNVMTDPAVFAQEQERIFEARWFAAVRSSDVGKPGAYRTVDVGRESVVVVRGRDGALRAFLNVCRHRGARLCMESAGETARNLQCGYHAWTYGLDGRLVAAPNLAGMADVDRTAFGLVPVALREWLGYAWVCLADEPPSFDDTVVGVVAARLGGTEVVEGWDIAGLEVGRRITYEVAANWKLVIENFMECYHCATIHPELTEVLPEFADGFAAQFYVGHGAAFAEDAHGFTVDGGEGVGRLPGVTEGHDRRYYAVTVNPQVFLNLVPDHVILHRMYPVSAERTVVECDWLYARDLIESGADLSRSVELFHRVNQQDFDACERCQLAASSRAYAAGGVLVPSEHHIGEFHRWVLDQLA
ncbi:MAG: aromatic ring-hydroxylating dioxygenase subunit alpha [Pseudonocardia sp.]|nr:aromatic ring-hydroxylating dioxygenase subunit alpha [Pseudonocardia sp.]